MTAVTPAAKDPAGFVRANTRLERPSLLPELQLHLASEVVPLWQASEAELEAIGLPPPYWAFAWAGGQGLARYLLDNPEVVAGKRVLDFASGSGVAGLAAAKAGAAEVFACDIDPFACAALALNAAANDLSLTLLTENLLAPGASPPAVDIVMAGDVCYERGMAEPVEAFLRHWAAAGKLVLMGDPGRSYLPRERLEERAVYRVPTTRELEDSDLRRVTVWQVLA